MFLFKNIICFAFWILIISTLVATTFGPGLHLIGENQETYGVLWILGGLSIWLGIIGSTFEKITHKMSDWIYPRYPE